MTPAEQLHITRGPVWVVGSTDEENALLDPLPDGVETVTERDEDDPEPVAAAILVVDDADTAPATLDEALPRVGSVPLVWVVLPVETRGEQAASIEAVVADYGWRVTERADLDGTWTALRVEQA